MWFTKIWQIAQNASLVCLVDQGKFCSNFIVSIKMSTNNFIAFEVSVTFFLQQVKHFACQTLGCVSCRWLQCKNRKTHKRWIAKKFEVSKLREEIKAKDGKYNIAH